MVVNFGMKKILKKLGNCDTTKTKSIVEEKALRRMERHNLCEILMKIWHVESMQCSFFKKSLFIVREIDIFNEKLTSF
jgi:hypothetical protein